jgi:hypothetical protein
MGFCTGNPIDGKIARNQSGEWRVASGERIAAQELAGNSPDSNGNLSIKGVVSIAGMDTLKQSRTSARLAG